MTTLFILLVLCGIAGDAHKQQFNIQQDITKNTVEVRAYNPERREPEHME